MGWKRGKTFLLVLFFNFSPTFFENEIKLSQLLIKSLLKTPSNKIFSWPVQLSTKPITLVLLFNKQEIVKYDNESNGVQYLNITFFGPILLIFLADKIQFIGFNVFICLTILKFDFE